MQKEIIYKGFSASPSDYECPDGELAAAIGLVPEESGLQAPLPPKKSDVDYGDSEVLCIHEGNGYTHYILKDGNKVKWGNVLLKDFGSYTIYSAEPMGNTVVVLTSNGMYYFLWKEESNSYKDLGNHLPELPIQFGLIADRISADGGRVEYNNGWDVHIPYPGTEGQTFPPERNETHEDNYLRQNTNDYIGSVAYSDEIKNTVTEQVLARVNSKVEEYRRQGYFLFPFFVRYGYQLRNGSRTMFSAPVLMTIASKCNPYVAVTGVHSTETDPAFEETDAGWNMHRHMENQRMDITLYFSRARLGYKVLTSRYLEKVKDWKDIIQSVDIFISEPLWTYDQGGKCVGINYDIDRFTTGGRHSICKTEGFFSNEFKGVTDTEMFNGLDLLNRPYVKLPLKPITETEIENGSQVFRCLKQINLNELQCDSIQAISIPEGTLISLSSSLDVIDGAYDYDSHDTLIPTSSYSYNSRLNITGISKKYKLYHAASMMPYTDGNEQVRLWGKLTTEQGQRVVGSTDNGLLAKETWINTNAPIHFLFFPFTGVYEAEAVLFLDPVDNTDYYRKLTLKRHPYLNGFYFFSNWDLNPREYGERVDYPVGYNEPVSLPNKIYTSDANNPFVFPVGTINTLENARKIYATCSAAKALSEGQFGQFPLYAFTENGVWAMELATDGSYKAKQPITRDVCIDTESITQIDSAVLFATDRGIMMISGSNTTCISDELNERNVFNPSSLPKIDNVITEYINPDSLDYVPFLTFVYGCRMIYDYVHQRIIVFNPQYRYAYVYSLKSKKWGMMYSTIQKAINSYPNALAVIKDENENNVIVDYSKDSVLLPSVGSQKGVIITRPIKLDEPDTLKTVNTVITRGKFEKGHVKTILYGSRDLENWHLIASSVDHTLRYLHGTPYKYFRIVLLCDLEKGESIISSTIEYTNKYADQIR